MFGRYTLYGALLLFAAAPAHADEFLVHDQDEYAQALSRVEAGDTVILANGEWRDFEMAITGTGRADAPITLAGQTPGAVILTGQSNLRIGGQHIVVSGLVFRDGYSPTGEVISFRIDGDDLAHHARVTQVVIDHFSKPARNETDYWVTIFGQNNRFDHNHLVGKTNAGVTLAVRLATEESRENNHLIDHNYFGPRPVLGSNGGETLRIGTSHYSMFDSRTVVENNVFDRTSGEVEIISIKSGANVVRGNLFLRSQGALTLRHGDGNVIERNVFLGHGLDHTGGIRVINRGQIVRENYMEGLRGYGFTSALTVMNGVPNSPVNRYVQVENALIERNSILDSSRITLGAGADEERSAAPVNSYFYANLLSGTGDGDFIEVDADISGITMASNVLLAGQIENAAANIPKRSSALVRGDNGLLYPADSALAETGAPQDMTVLSLQDVGVFWYDKPAESDAFGFGREIPVAATQTALLQALAAAQDGDTLVLAPGTYALDRIIPVTRALTIKAAAPAGAPVILTFSRPSLFQLGEGGRLRLSGLVIDGSNAPDSAGNAVISTDSAPIRGNLQIEMDAVQVRDLTINRDFDVIHFGPASLADSVKITRSEFEDISGAVVSGVSERDDQGRYNVDYLTIEDSVFRNVTGALAEIYRGGTDESTFGPHVLIARSTLENVGLGAGSSVHLHGVQEAAIEGNVLIASAPMRITHTVGVPSTRIDNNIFDHTPAPQLTELNFAGDPRAAMNGNEFRQGAGQ